MLYCDWCGEPIEEADFATIEPGGWYRGGRPIRMRNRTYHTSHDYSDGPSEWCCFARALRLLNDDGAFKTPDAGMTWKLVPTSETHNRVYAHSYTESALGTTPLVELNLTEATYRKLTREGVFTVEHLVDARVRGEHFCLGTQQLGRLDASLLERGLLPTSQESEAR